ncbi:hypothetical protein [Actinoalloteichus caeruleus]|uniref:hypothetical protein n=1 Tax=Actinoalloteichus cyanogriseus TaxID=2893586 RepID=UPI0004AB68BC|nr:hypothetical protein [Actinoalloteichus caeruleus]
MTLRRWLLVGSTLFFVFGVVAGITWTDPDGLSQGTGAPPAGRGVPSAADPSGDPGALPGERPEALSSGSAGWTRPLAPAERAPQLVLLAVEGTPSPAEWRRMTEVATTTGAGLTVFLPASAIGDAHAERRAGRAPSSDSPVFRALGEGHEVGLLVRGADCASPRHPANPEATIRRAVSQLAELGGQDSPLPARTGVLLRCAEPTSPTPGLPDRVDYTTWGRTSLPQWPEREDGRWVLRALDLGHDGDADGATGARPNSATAPVATVPARTRIRDLHDSTRGSNRAPLVLTTRSTRWSDELFVSALREELLGVCPAEETVCATHAQAVEWLDLQNRDTLLAYQRMVVPHADQAPGTPAGDEAEDRGRPGGAGTW